MSALEVGLTSDVLEWQQLGSQRYKVEIYISPHALIHYSVGSFSRELMLMFHF